MWRERPEVPENLLSADRQGRWGILPFMLTCSHCHSSGPGRGSLKSENNRTKEENRPTRGCRRLLQNCPVLNDKESPIEQLLICSLNAQLLCRLDCGLAGCCCTDQQPIASV